METEKMIVESVQIDAKLQIVPFDPGEIAEVLGHPEARVWIDLEGFQAGDLETWLDKLNVQGLARRLCLEANARPGFYPLKDEIILVIPILIPASSSNETAHVALFIRENLLLTFHQKHVLNPQAFSFLQEASEAWLSERSVAALVSAIMVQQSNESLRHIAELRSMIFDLEQQMDRGDLAAEYYGKHIFDDATFADLKRPGAPVVVINATDLATGMRFSSPGDTLVSFAPISTNTRCRVRSPPLPPYRFSSPLSP